MIASVIPVEAEKGAVSIDWLTMNIWLEDGYVKVDFEIVFDVYEAPFKGFTIILNESLKNLKTELCKGTSLSETHFLDEHFGKYFFGPSWSIIDKEKRIVKVKEENLTVLIPAIEIKSIDRNAIVTLMFKDVSGSEEALDKGRHGLAFYLIFEPLEEVLDETRSLFYTRVYDRQLISEGVFTELGTTLENAIHINNVHVYLVLPENGDIIKAPDHTRYGNLEGELNPWGLPARLDVYWVFNNVDFPNRNFRILAEYEQEDIGRLILQKERRRRLMLEVAVAFLVSLLASALITYAQASINLGIISFIGFTIILVVFLIYKREENQKYK